MLHGPGRELSAARDPELAQDIAHVRACRSGADDQLSRDLPIGETAANQLGHIAHAW